VSDKLNLAEIEARAQAAAALAEQATAGPWLAATDDWTDVTVHANPSKDWDDWVANVGDWGRHMAAWNEEKQQYDQVKYRHICEPDIRDAAFIAAARTDVPALAADVQALVAEVKRLQTDVEEWATAAQRRWNNLEQARGLLMDCWHQLDGDVYVLPGGEVHPGAVTTIHALHAFLWPEGKTI